MGALNIWLSEQGFRAGLKGLLDGLTNDVWEDLRFPANSIDPTGLTGAAAVITDVDTFPGCLSFVGNLDNVCAGIAQMPHGWKKASTLRPHIHWLKPTGSASAVTWELYYRRLGFAGTTAEAWSTALTGTIVAGDQTVSNQHLISSFGDITMANMRESSMLAWKLYRRGSTDADNNAVTLLEFDIHYQVDKNGTSTEIPSA
jgi:hypothetical protein